MRLLFHLILSVVLVSGAAYLLFFVDLGGQSLGSHLGEIWRSPVVQRKVGVVEKSIEKKVAEKLAAAGKHKASAEPGSTARADADQVTQNDRKSLDELIGKISHSTN